MWRFPVLSHELGRIGLALDAEPPTSIDDEPDTNPDHGWPYTRPEIYREWD